MLDRYQSVALFSLRHCFVAGALLCWLVSPGWSLTLQLQFSDTSVFATDAIARASIEQAAADISAALTSPLSAIDRQTFFNTQSNVNREQYRWDYTSSTISNQTLSSTWGWNYTYTLNGSPVHIPATIVPANTIQILVRGQGLSGSTLGTGGPAGISFAQGYQISAQGGIINQGNLQAQFEQVVDYHENAAQSEFLRGEGPVISSISGTTQVNFGGNIASAPYSVSYGPAYGTLALDTSYPSGQYTDYWHIDHTTPVAAGKNDLYSVALHEMLHAIGVGSSLTWTSYVSGNNWTGVEAIAEHGTGANLVTADHIASGIMSRRITDGAMQEVAMDPSITQGTRKYLTTLDLAFLRDLGYSTQTYEFGIEGDFNDDGIVNLADYTLWRDNLGAATEAAIHFRGNGGGITAADYTLWKTNFGLSSGSIDALTGMTSIPEPASGWFAVFFAFAVLGYWRIHRTLSQKLC